MSSFLGTWAGQDVRLGRRGYRKEFRIGLSLLPSTSMIVRGHAAVPSYSIAMYSIVNTVYSHHIL